MKKLIIFDWNGTLLADAHACMDADNEVLKHFGGKIVDIKTYRNTTTIPSINFYVNNGCDYEELLKKAKEVSKIFHGFYELRSSKCRTRQGAKRLLKWLHQQSIKSIILSNHTLIGVNNQLKRHKIVNLFLDVLANSMNDSALKRRNKKDKLREFLKIHKYKPSDAFIIGDSSEEVEIGKDLGIGTVSITNGYSSTSRLRAAKPDFIVHTLDEFREIIKRS